MCGKTKGFQQFPALKNKISPKSTFKCKSPAALHTQKQQQSHKHPLKPCRKSSANHRCVYVYVYVYVHTHIYILYSSYFLESTEERGKNSQALRNESLNPVFRPFVQEKQRGTCSTWSSLETGCGPSCH